MKFLKIRFLSMMVIGVMAFVMSGCGSSGGGGTSPTPIPPVVTLNEIRISPVNLTLPIGVEAQYEAIGVYSDGSTKDVTPDVTWISSDENIAIIDALGNLKSIGVGVSEITAKLGNVSNSTKVRVLDESVNELKSIQLAFKSGYESVTVPKGTTGTLVATAYMTDGTSFIANEWVTFIASNKDVVEIMSNGDVEAIGVGKSDIIATYEPKNITSNTVDVTVTAATLQSIIVHPSIDTIHVGESLEYSADGHYSDGTTVNITKDVSWESSDIAVVKMDNNIARAVGAGTTTISATHDGITGTGELNVKDLAIKNIQLTFANGETDVTVPKGTTGNLVVTAIYADNSTADITKDVKFDYNPKVVDIEIGGYAHAVGVGSTDIVAIYIDGQKSNIAKLTVTDAVITGLTITPVDTSIPNNSKINYSAKAKYSDGDEEDVTRECVWESSEPKVVSIGNKPLSGVAEAYQEGTVEIRATFDGISNSTNLTVISVKPGYIYEDNIRWAKSITDITDTTVKGTTGILHKAFGERQENTAVWYYLQEGQGYRQQPISEVNFSFDATLAGDSSLVYVKVYLSGDGAPDSNSIYNDQDWIDLQTAHPNWIIRTNYYEWSEDQSKQCNFILRFGDTNYQGVDEKFVINKYIVSQK